MKRSTSILVAFVLALAACGNGSVIQSATAPTSLQSVAPTTANADRGTSSVASTTPATDVPATSVSATSVSATSVPAATVTSRTPATPTTAAVTPAPPAEAAPVEAATATTATDPLSDCVLIPVEVLRQQNCIPPAILAPQVTCRDDRDLFLSKVLFGYSNQSASPVYVPEGPSNYVTGEAPGDNPFLTTLFAPGVISAGFWAYTPRYAPASWTLTGPDGVARTADATGPQPDCAGLVPVDPRAPKLTVTGQRISSAGDSLQVDVELSGVPVTSVCNRAFQADPVLVSIVGNSAPTSARTSATLVGSLRPREQEPGQVADLGYVNPLVVDQCSALGVTVRSWPVDESVNGVGSRVCAYVDVAGNVSVNFFTGGAVCDPLALPTGGSSIRPT